MGGEMTNEERFKPMEESEWYKFATRPSFYIGQQPYSGALPADTVEAILKFANKQITEKNQHVKELQDLLAKEKDRSDMFRKQRDELQRRIDLLSDILEGFDPNA